MHIEPTKGNKKQAEDYINKRGKWEEKGEEILCVEKRGEIKGSQGKRNDLTDIEELLKQGLTPKEIMSISLAYRKHEKIIRDAFFAKRSAETPFLRGLTVYYHAGESGSGKSYVAKRLIDEYGEDDVYFLTDCENGGFDMYCGQRNLFIDEFRGQMKFSVLLNSILSPYKSQVHSRYSNIVGLWDKVHITSVLPPEKLYKKMVEENQDYDTF